MSPAAATPQPKRYSTATHNLRLISQCAWQADLAIVLEDETVITRALYRNTWTDYDRHPVDSQDWTDSVLPRRTLKGRKVVSPWCVWTKAAGKIDELEIVGTGSGKWMLLPLSKAGIQSREKTRKDEAAALAAAKKQADVEQKMRIRELKGRRAQEAKALLASVETPKGQPAKAAAPLQCRSPPLHRPRSLRGSSISIYSRDSVSKDEKGEFRVDSRRCVSHSNVRQQIASYFSRRQIPVPEPKKGTREDILALQDKIEEWVYERDELREKTLPLQQQDNRARASHKTEHFKLRCMQLFHERLAKYEEEGRDTTRLKNMEPPKPRLLGNAKKKAANERARAEAIARGLPPPPLWTPPPGAKRKYKTFDRNRDRDENVKTSAKYPRGPPRPRRLAV